MSSINQLIKQKQKNTHIKRNTIKCHRQFQLSTIIDITLQKKERMEDRSMFCSLNMFVKHVYFER